MTFLFHSQLYTLNKAEFWIGYDCCTHQISAPMVTYARLEQDQVNQNSNVDGEGALRPHL